MAISCHYQLPRFCHYSLLLFNPTTLLNLSPYHSHNRHILLIINPELRTPVHPQPFLNPLCIPLQLVLFERLRQLLNMLFPYPFRPINLRLTPLKLRKPSFPPKPCTFNSRPLLPAISTKRFSRSLLLLIL